MIGRPRVLDKRIQVGSKVFITDGGHSYTSWTEMADQMHMKHYRGTSGPYDEAKAKEVVEVVSILAHPNDYHTLYGVRCTLGTTREYILNEDGVKFHSTANVFDDDLFNL